jgi:hypothetical protein
MTTHDERAAQKEIAALIRAAVADVEAGGVRLAAENQRLRAVVDAALLATTENVDTEAWPKLSLACDEYQRLERPELYCQVCDELLPCDCDVIAAALTPPADEAGETA